MNQMPFLLEATSTSGIGGYGIIILYVAIFAIFWFLVIRPQRKKQKAVDDMQNSIEVGNSVLTTGGLYGKVVDLVNDIVVVEFGTNKSIRIPVQRASIASVSEPDMTTTSDDDDEEETKDTKDKKDK